MAVIIVCFIMILLIGFLSLPSALYCINPKYFDAKFDEDTSRVNCIARWVKTAIQHRDWQSRAKLYVIIEMLLIGVIIIACYIMLK